MHHSPSSDNTPLQMSPTLVEIHTAEEQPRCFLFSPEHVSVVLVAMSGFGLDELSKSYTLCTFTLVTSMNTSSTLDGCYDRKGRGDLLAQPATIPRYCLVR